MCFIRIFTIVLLFYSATSIAADNFTGIWAGKLIDILHPDYRLDFPTSPPEKAETFYISIHQTDTQVVLIFLSAAEKTGDLFSSTYIGESINSLKSIGNKAYFPNYNFPNAIYSIEYVDSNPLFSLKIRPDKTPKNAFISFNSELADFSSYIVMERIL